MFAAIYLPDFLLQAQLRNSHESQPTVMAEASSSNDGKIRIIALNSAARERKIEIGMTTAQGQARYGELVVLHRSEKSERNTQDVLLQLANSWTPDFEDTSPGVSTLGLVNARCGDEWELGWAAVEEMAEKYSLRVQVGFAKTPDLALIVAKQADPVRSVTGDTDDDFLRNLPINILNPPTDLAMVFTLWGIGTVGDFLTLPECDISERLGPDAMELRELVSGKRSRLLRLVRPPKDFSQTTEFDYEVEVLEPLLFTLHRVLETVCARLRSAWLCASEVYLGFRYADGSGYHRVFRVPDPNTDVELLYRIIYAHLENFLVKSPIISLQLEVKPARAPGRQLHLFESGLRDPNRFAETLARLEALLGSDNVGIPEQLDTHRPDAFSVCSFDEAKDQKTAADQTPRLGLPLRRFRPPVFVDVTLSPIDRRPVEIRSQIVRGDIRDHRGPWAGSGDWWRGENDHDSRWARVEWDIEISNSNGGGLYLLVCEKGSDWKLEGIYG